MQSAEPTFYDHPVPSCFFSSTSFVVSRNQGAKPLTDVWWDHEFISQGQLRDDLGNEVAINLAATWSKEDDYYSDPQGSAVFELFRKAYSLSIKLVKIGAVEEYFSKIDKQTELEKFSLIAYPTCRQHGLHGFTRPAPHFCVVTGRHQGGYIVQDQETKIQASLDAMRERFEWSLSQSGFLPWYEIVLDSSNEVRDSAQLGDLYASTMNKFLTGGKELLLQYCDDIPAALDGTDRYVQDGMLWTLPLCRRAEIFFLESFGDTRFAPLKNLLYEISFNWNVVLLAIRKNLSAGSAINKDIAKTVEKVRKVELEYFSRLEAILS